MTAVMPRLTVPGDIEGRALGVIGVGDDAPAWAREIVARSVTAQTARCKHLRRRPERYGLLNAIEGIARCEACVERHVDAIGEPAPGAFGAAADSRVECCRCRRLFVVNEMTPLVIMALPWTVWSAICGPCEARENSRTGRAT